jgi:hypothetical protein
MQHLITTVFIRRKTWNCTIAELENTTKKVKVNDDDEGDEADDQAEAEAELLAEDKASAEWDEEMVPVPVDAGHLADLIDMGFSDIRARKGD